MPKPLTYDRFIECVVYWLANDVSYVVAANRYGASPATFEKYCKGGTEKARQWLKMAGTQRVMENVQRRKNAKPCKLTPEDVIVIKDLLENTTISVSIMARMFDVKPATIYAVKNGHNWAWLTSDNGANNDG